MNGAPDWQDGECCFRCRTQFTLVARKHHCRNCGNIFCAKCSSQQIPLPKLNIDKPVRVCDTCYEKISSKSADPLALALDTKGKEQTKTKTIAASSSKSVTSSSSSSSGNKQAANNASAPSEQELKEEEEFQLALALSLSETPTKVSFPDFRQLEEPTPSSSSTSVPVQVNPSAVTTNNNTTQHSSTVTGISPQRASIQQTPVSKSSSGPIAGVDQHADLNSLSQSTMQQHQVTQVIQPPPPAQPEYQIQGRDLEVFKYVGEIQSTLEVFNNRLESCKLRGRPVANDAAIQSSFLKLNSEYQPKLAEYIRTYEEERAYYERLQDKLSQISDARAALDDLREEHQEKIRQEAAEAERNRQSQLASKLEAMRQKKSQMMQYQRELALQRIREQEMMSQQQQAPAGTPVTSQVYQAPPSVTGPHYLMSGQNPADHTQQQLHDSMHSNSMIQQQPQPPTTTMHQDWPSQQLQGQYAAYIPNQQTQHYQQTHQQPTALKQVQQQQQPPIATQQPYAPPAQPVIDRASLAHLERQFLPNSKPEEDTPLISFDD